jgi:hypothetical protein
MEYVFIPSPKDDAIMKTLFYVMEKGKKRWTIMSQHIMLTRIREIYNITMSRSCLCRRLAKLRDFGYIESETRHRREKGTGLFIPDKTIFFITEKLKKYISKIFNFFKSVFGLSFGFSDLTEYTVRENRRKFIGPPKPPKSPPYNPPQSPNRTNWSNLGGRT